MKKLKIAGIALGGLLALVGTGFGVASLKASARLGQHFETHRLALAMPASSDEAAIARGKHLVEARYSCNVCHGPNLAGGTMIDDPAIGRVLGPNITAGSGGRTAKYTMADWDRIVRHGVKPDGSPAVMPSEDFFKMSDQELTDVVAYVRSTPPVAAQVPAPSFGPIGKVLLALGKFPVSAEIAPNHMGAHTALPPDTGDTKEFGEHLAAICLTCHRANLAGGPMPFGPPDWPPSANLTPHASGLGDWTFEDFERAITLGTTKAGKTLRDPMTLVLPAGRAMSATERKALWTYLRSVPPHATNE